MILLTIEQLHDLRPLLTPDRPGPAVGLHVMYTGHGACYADRWPNPRAGIVYTTGNYSLFGDPDALTPDDLATHIEGIVDAPDAFVPLLRRAFPDVTVWQNKIFELPKTEPSFRILRGTSIRRLDRGDVRHLWGLSFVNAWICKTWGGPPGVASSGWAWGAFMDGKLVAVALSFYVGDRYENIAVVTEPAARGRGVAGACAAKLIRDIEMRGRRASCTIALENRASARAAQKVGFVEVRSEPLYVVGVKVPNFGCVPGWSPG